jgi:3-methyladenine DNA glycosylase AlkD
VAKNAGEDAPWAAVRARLCDAGDPALAERYRNIAPTEGTVLGIAVPVLRGMAREIATASTRELTISEMVGMADVAFASACREEMLLATFLLARFKNNFGPSHWRKVDRWIDRVDNWETCDQLATGVAGEMLARAADRQRTSWLRDLEKWARSPNPWRRRFAVVTTTVLNQKGRNDARAGLHICGLVIADGDKTVQKAVAWALREACKSDPGAVWALLKRHRAAMSPAVLRRSAEKLTASQRTSLGV